MWSNEKESKVFYEEVKRLLVNDSIDVLDFYYKFASQRPYRCSQLMIIIKYKVEFIGIGTRFLYDEAFIDKTKIKIIIRETSKVAYQLLQSGK